MTIERILEIYARMRLEFYRKVFTRVRERDGSLSAMEVFSLEVIHALDRPTISQFARFIGISQSNATYKVHSLINKGYLLRTPSGEDGREYNLEMSDKFYSYSNMFEEDARAIATAVVNGLDGEERKVLSKMGDLICQELERIYDKETQDQR